MRLFNGCPRCAAFGQLYLTMAEVAARWRLRPQTLVSKRMKKRGPHYITVASRVRYPLESVLLYESNRLGGVSFADTLRVIYNVKGVPQTSKDAIVEALRAVFSETEGEENYCHSNALIVRPTR